MWMVWNGSENEEALGRGFIIGVIVTASLSFLYSLYVVPRSE